MDITVTEIMELADLHAHAKITEGTPAEQLPRNLLQHKMQEIFTDFFILQCRLIEARREIASLQGQLEAVGAGGVGPLLGAAAQAQEDAPDMFWDADDTENFAHEVQDIVDGYCSGEIVTIECAKRMPNFRVLITGEDDNLAYEHIDAAIEAQKGDAA